MLVRAAPLEPPDNYREVITTLTTGIAVYSGITRQGYAVMSASEVGYGLGCWSMKEPLGSVKTRQILYVLVSTGAR